MQKIGHRGASGYEPEYTLREDVKMLDLLYSAEAASLDGKRMAIA